MRTSSPAAAPSAGRARRGPLMRLLRLASGALLLLAGAGAGLHVYLGDESPLPALVETGRVFGKAEDRGFEEVADYWLEQEGRGGRRDLKGNGTALALAIRIGRAEALRSGAAPVPDALKRRFRTHFPDDVLEGTRWIVAAPNSRLGRILARWPVEEGAVTLGDVIVFKTRAASRNRRLFAHELAHVVQYRRLGIGPFARLYARDPEPIEAEARAKARSVPI